MPWKCDILETKCYRFLLPLHQFDTQLPVSPHWHTSFLVHLCEVALLDLSINMHTRHQHITTLMKVCIPVRPPRHTDTSPRFTHTNEEMLSSSCTSPYVQKVLIPLFLSHTMNICQSETRHTLYSIFWIKSFLLFLTALPVTQQIYLRKNPNFVERIVRVCFI